MVLKQQLLLSLLSVIVQDNGKYNHSISTWSFNVTEINKLRRLKSNQPECPENGEKLYIIHLCLCLNHEFIKWLSILKLMSWTSEGGFQNSCP